MTLKFRRLETPEGLPNEFKKLFNSMMVYGAKTNDHTYAINFDPQHPSFGYTATAKRRVQIIGFVSKTIDLGNHKTMEEAVRQCERFANGEIPGKILEPPKRPM